MASEFAQLISRVRAALQEEPGEARRLELAQLLQQLERSVERAQDERGVDRMRMIESVRRMVELERSNAELERSVRSLSDEVRARDATISSLAREVRARDLGIAGQHAEILRLNAILAQDGHQLLNRLGAFLAPHPTIFAIARLPTRFLRWLTGRTSR
jgi:hypothetical protein